MRVTYPAGAEVKANIVKSEGRLKTADVVAHLPVPRGEVPDDAVLLFTFPNKYAKGWGGVGLVSGTCEAVFVEQPGLDGGLHHPSGVGYWLFDTGTQSGSGFSFNVKFNVNTDELACAALVLWCWLWAENVGDSLQLWFDVTYSAGTRNFRVRFLNGTGWQYYTSAGTWATIPNSNVSREYWWVCPIVFKVNPTGNYTSLFFGGQRWDLSAYSPVFVAGAAPKLLGSRVMLTSGGTNRTYFRLYQLECYVW